MDRFSFNGRPDGIGNRMEEIIQLEAICSKLDVTCEYVWRNAYEHRSYEICCEAKRVEIVSVPTPALPVRQFSDFSFTHTQEEILECAKMIKPRFEQVFPEGVKPVGVHVRGTDRINRNGLVNHPLNMRDVEELKAYIVRTLHEINEIKPEHVFICADSEDSKEVFLEHLDPSITVVEPRNSGGVSLEYSDFFALSKCSKIWMVSRFSSFAITASMIVGCSLVSFVKIPKIRDRYKAKFEYRDLSS